MEIRNATKQDWKAIVKLMNVQDELFLIYPKGKYPFTVEQFEKIAQERKELTVGIIQGEIVTFANLYNLKEKESAFIGNVITNK
ncbi:MAG: hypothetical protein ACI86H_000823 [bacterium]|jgi:hypothetical protein